MACRRLRQLVNHMLADLSRSALGMCPDSGLGRITVSTGALAWKRPILSQALAQEFQSGFKCHMI